MSDERRTYVIKYRCALDPACPVFQTTVKAYDECHARERFYDDDDQDWRIVSIQARKESR